jgi:hypothetical protein
MIKVQEYQPWQRDLQQTKQHESSIVQPPGNDEGCITTVLLI